MSDNSTSTMIIFPHSSTSLRLAEGLLNEGHDLYLYLPTEVHKKWSYTLPLELQILAVGLPNSVTVVTDLQQLINMNVIVIPSLDVLPQKTRADFSSMCNITFQKMAEEGAQFKEDVSIFCVGNTSGLICGYEFGQVFPHLRHNLVIISSIFYASRQVCGEKGNRAYPVITTNGEGKLMWIKRDESDMVKSMKGTWELDAFGLIEAKSIIEAVSCKTGPGDLNMLEMFGRFPTEEEAFTLKLESDVPVWFGCAGSEPTDKIKLDLQIMSHWMKTGCAEI